MSAVRPSPLHYGRLRDAALLSPPLTPVFAEERRAGAVTTAAARHSRSDTCLAVRPERAPVYRHPLNAAHLPPPPPPPPPVTGTAAGISPQQQARRRHQQQQRTSRRRLFELGGAGLELEIATAAKMSSMAEAPTNLWQPHAGAGKTADKCFPKSNSTTTCGIENVRAYSSKGIDFFCRSQNLEQKSLLDCNPDYKPEVRNKLLGSPTSQRSQDSGFSDSGESNCDSQSDEQKRERRVRFEKRSFARTLTKMMRGSSPARRAVKSAGDGSLPKPILTTSNHSASTSSLSRPRARAGHTPAKTRFSRGSLQVVEEHRSFSASCVDLSLASRAGPLTSSPVRPDHVLECSAIERELDSILERAELPDTQHVTVRAPRASLNDTTIDFSPRPALDGRSPLRRGERRPPQRRWSQLLPAGEPAAASLPRRPRSVWNLEAAAADLQARRFCSLPREQQRQQQQQQQPALRIGDVR